MIFSYINVEPCNHLIFSYERNLTFFLQNATAKDIFFTEQPWKSLTEFRQQMHSGNLHAYLFLNCSWNSIVTYFWCVFAQIQAKSHITQNSTCVWKTNSLMDTLSYVEMQETMNEIKKKSQREREREREKEREREGAQTTSWVVSFLPLVSRWCLDSRKRGER